MIDFFKLQFPKGMNLDILFQRLPVELDLDSNQLERLKGFITRFSTEKRKHRIIILPSDKLIKKLISHYYLREVAEGRMKKIMAVDEETKTIDRIIGHLKLTFEAERPPPPQIVQQQLLIAAEEHGEYF